MHLITSIINIEMQDMNSLVGVYTSDCFGYDATRSVASQTSKDSFKVKRKIVKIACIHCKKACKKCDESRPCTRCVRTGTAASCIDAPRKKRKVKSAQASYSTPKADDKIYKISINGILLS